MPSAAPLPREWLELVGAPRHIMQGDAIACAPTKGALVDYLYDNGVRVNIAASVVDDLRLRTGPPGSLPTGWQMLVDADVIDLSEPGLWWAHHIVKNAQIGYIGAGGARLVARIGYKHQRGLFVDEVYPLTPLA